MPQPLRRQATPIDWSIQAVANHPVLTSGVGACVTAFASAEALMGVFLATIRWENAPTAIDVWAEKRSIREKLQLVKKQAELEGDIFLKLAVRVLDDFTALSKRRSKLAHGFFGIVTDRENQFAWRPGSAPARSMAAGLASGSFRAPPMPKTWIYSPRDFAELTESCARTFEEIGSALKLLPIVHGLTSPLPAPANRLPGGV